jgi:alpha-1,2-mannosyltransferase
VKVLALYGAFAAIFGAGWFCLVRGPVADYVALSPRRTWLARLLVLAASFAIAEPQGAMWQDFLDAYYRAGRASLSSPAAVLQLMNEGVHGFVNPPGVAYLFAPWGLLPPSVSAGCFAALGVAASLLALHYAEQAVALDAHPRRVVALVFVAFGPLANSLREGNTTHFALLALFVALSDLHAGRDARAGALIGAAAVVKLPLLSFAAYLVWRGRWRAVLAGASVLSAVAVLSLGVFGWRAHVSWYESFVAQAGERPLAAFNVQSVVALLARLERDGAALVDWNGYPLSGDARWVARGVVALTLSVTLFVCARDRRQVSSADPATMHRLLDLEFSLFTALACLISPLVWTHYCALLLVPITVGLSAAHSGRPSSLLRWLWRAAVLATVPPVVWPSRFLFAGGPWGDALRLGVSHYLLGGFALLALLLTARARLFARP